MTAPLKLAERRASKHTLPRHEKVSAFHHIFLNSGDPPLVLMNVRSKVGDKDAELFADQLMNIYALAGDVSIRLNLSTDDLEDSITVVFVLAVYQDERLSLSDRILNHYKSTLQDFNLQTSFPRLPVFFETLFLSDGASFQYHGDVSCKDCELGSLPRLLPFSAQPL